MNIRKIAKTAGGSSYAITLPIDVVRRWGWKEKQKVELIIDEKNKVIKIKDWKK
jgi:bifunctional DNA-binding transcriptional regulator/antitoxin component of YhaV-PrlF toxin-antitoxin module